MTRVRLRVKEVAEGKGVNMSVLSHRTYIALSTIRAIYRDPYKSVTTETLQRIANALEVSVFDLMEEVPDDPTESERPS